MALQAFTLVPANPNNLMEITPVNRHRYPTPITQAMLNRPQDPPLGTPGTPVISAIDPTTAKLTVPATDIVVNIYGSGFFPTSVITIGGADVGETDFVSSVQLQTVMKVTATGTFAFKVRNGASLSVASMNLVVT